MARSISCGDQAEILRLPIVEFLRQVADRGILARVDLRQNVLDRLAHLGVGGLDARRVHSAFEIAGHGSPPVRCTRPRVYLIACGLIGEPVPPVMISGGPQKKNS